MRLRTACELELSSGEKSVNVKRPEAFVLSSAIELSKEISALITKSKKYFAEESVTKLKWNNPKG